MKYYILLCLLNSFTYAIAMNNNGQIAEQEEKVLLTIESAKSDRTFRINNDSATVGDLKATIAKVTKIPYDTLSLRPKVKERNNINFLYDELTDDQMVKDIIENYNTSVFVLLSELPKSARRK